MVYNNIKGTLYRPIEKASMPDRNVKPYLIEMSPMSDRNVSAWLTISLPQEWKDAGKHHFYALV